MVVKIHTHTHNAIKEKSKKYNSHLILLFLFYYSGSSNVVGIEFCLMHKGHVVIVMPYYPHQRFSVSYKFKFLIFLHIYVYKVFLNFTVLNFLCYLFIY